MWYGARKNGWDGTIPDTSEVGTPLFIGSVALIIMLAAVMRVLPLLQARYAFTHDWRVFYDWKTILRLNYLDPVGGILLAVLYGLAAHLLHNAANLTVNVSGWAYGLEWIFVLFLTILFWTFLRLAAVWIYPRVLREALANNILALDSLHTTEKELIKTLSWTEKPAKRGAVRQLICLGAPVIQLIVWALTAVLLAGGMDQTQSGSGTLAQHPLIHLPWVSPADPVVHQSPDPPR